MASINQQALDSSPLTTPSLHEQQRIADQLRTSLRATEELLASAKARLAEIERLPARLLAQALGEAAV